MESEPYSLTTINDFNANTKNLVKREQMRKAFSYLSESWNHWLKLKAWEQLQSESQSERQ